MTMKTKYLEALLLVELLRESFRNADDKVNQLKIKNIELERDFVRLTNVTKMIICEINKLDEHTMGHNNVYTLQRLREYIDDIVFAKDDHEHNEMNFNLQSMRNI